MKENWKTCIECDVYEVSNLGNVRRSFGNIISNSIAFKNLVQVTDKGGYKKVCLSKKGKHIFAMVHKLIASAFIGKRPDSYEINHIDGIKANNALSNLEYVTRKQNLEHAVRLGLMLKGECSSNVKLTNEQILEIRNLFPIISQGKLAKIYGVNQAHVSRIVRRTAWASI